MGFLIQSGTGFDVPWDQIGPKLCDAELIREMHGPVIASPSARWYWATSSECFVGFAILERKVAYWSLSYAWVSPSHRKRGLYGLLVASRVSHAQSIKTMPIRTLVHESRIATYNSAWRVQSRRGAWITLEMTL